MGGRWWVLALVLVVARVGRGGTPHSSEGNCSPVLSRAALVCLQGSDIIFFVSFRFQMLPCNCEVGLDQAVGEGR